MKRILVNATQAEELRVALVDGQKLYNLDIEPTSLQYKKGDIYKAVVTSVAPSLNAVFVDFGSERHGFLPFREIHRHWLKGDNRKSRLPIRRCIKKGDELPVQIAREERDEKGALLTTEISLVSRYLVLMPYSNSAHGVSQQIDGSERRKIYDILDDLDIRKHDSVIVRTSASGCSKEGLSNDLGYLYNLWDATEESIDEHDAPTIIYRESNIVIQAIRDQLQDDIDSVLIDSTETLEEAKAFVGKTMPAHLKKIQHYDGSVPLFSHMQIEKQIENAFERTISLPSGGSIVIDHTEAMTCIDINSARAVSGGDIEETALETNLEAADEIARQLRLRDLGGLIVIDFIDMLPDENKRKVQNALHAAVRTDRARIQTSDISRFGLVEMSRQRLRPSLRDTSHTLCLRCGGKGLIRTPESCALLVIRLVETEALKATVSKVVVEVPNLVRDFLFSQKGSAIEELERQHGVSITISVDAGLQTPNYRVLAYRQEDGQDVLIHTASDEPQQEDFYTSSADDKPSLSKRDAMTPAVSLMDIEMPSSSIFRRLSDFLKGLFSFGRRRRKSRSWSRGRRHSSRRTRGMRHYRDSDRRGRRGRRRSPSGRRSSQQGRRFSGRRSQDRRSAEPYQNRDDRRSYEERNDRSSNSTRSPRNARGSGERRNERGGRSERSSWGSDSRRSERSDSYSKQDEREARSSRNHRTKKDLGSSKRDAMSESQDKDSQSSAQDSHQPTHEATQDRSYPNQQSASYTGHNREYSKAYTQANRQQEESAKEGMGQETEAKSDMPKQKEVAAETRSRLPSSTAKAPEDDTNFSTQSSNLVQVGTKKSSD